MKFTTSLIKWGIALIGLIAAAGCTKDKTDAPDGYGYVQLRLYKSGSYSRAENNMLDYLHEAAKIKITLQSSDMSILSQTVNVDAAGKTEAEYGMQSDKFLLMADKYTVVAFEVYDKTDRSILAGEPSSTTYIDVIPGGIVVQDIAVSTIERGHVRFQLTKDLSAWTTRADQTSAYPFHAITYADVTVENVVTAERIEFTGLKMAHEIFRSEDDPLYHTSACKTDTIVSAKAGTYRIIGYTTYFDRNKKIAEVSTKRTEYRFTVSDNKTTDADVPVTLHESKTYIKDAKALKIIWDSLDGPNWKTKWDFNRDIDLWAAQPGVSVLEDGRIAILNLTAVGAKGHMPAIIGELSELRQLYLGTHSYEPSASKLNPSGTDRLIELAATDTEAFRRSFTEMFGQGVNQFETFSPELRQSLEFSGVPIKKAEIEPQSFPTANSPFNYSNMVYSLPREINQLKKLQYLYIAYSAIRSVPEDLSEMAALTDVEFYRCPDLEKFPDGLTTLPKLVTLIFSSNFKIGEEEMERALKLMNDSPTNAKTLQLLQTPNQPIKVVPDLTNLEALGLLNVQSCGIERFTTAFGKEHSFTSFLANSNKLTLAGLPRDAEGYFIGIEDVETMNFAYNNFEAFPDMFDSSSPWRIASLSFAFNNIREIENGGEGGSFKGVNAEVLSLAYNQMGFFPKDIIRADSRISYLQVQGNGIESIDEDSFDGKFAYYITVMDISYNKLKSLPGSFNGRTFPYMTGIDLSFNRFESFPYNPLNISALTTLICRHQRDANGNRSLREWPVGVYTHVGLRALFLGSNDIRKVNDIRISPQIYTLEIMDNPNIVIDVSTVCAQIRAGAYNLVYDSSQDIRGCTALDLD